MRWRTCSQKTLTVDWSAVRQKWNACFFFEFLLLINVEPALSTQYCYSKDKKYVSLKQNETDKPWHGNWNFCHFQRRLQKDHLSFYFSHGSVFFFFLLKWKYCGVSLFLISYFLPRGVWSSFLHSSGFFFGQENVNKPRWTAVISWRCLTSLFILNVRDIIVGSGGRPSSRDIITVMLLHQISPRGTVRSHPLNWQMLDGFFIFS